jgi:hypothetical protein
MLPKGFVSSLVLAINVSQTIHRWIEALTLVYASAMLPCCPYRKYSSLNNLVRDIPGIKMDNRVKVGVVCLGRSIVPPTDKGSDRALKLSCQRNHERHDNPLWEVFVSD